MIVTIELWANREGGTLEDISIPDIDPIDVEKLSAWFLREHVLLRTRRIFIGDVIRFQKERYMIAEDGVMKLDKIAS